MEAFLYDRTSNLMFLVWVQLYIEIQRFIFGCSGQKSRCLVSFLMASGRSSQIWVYYVCPDRSSDFIWDLGKLPFPLHLEKTRTCVVGTTVQFVDLERCTLLLSFISVRDFH